MESTEVSIQPQRWQHLSFSGCGFLCIYHAGVAAAIKEYAPQLLQNKILGASAGSIVATGLITNVCISHATSTILKVVSQARSRTMGPLHPEFDLLDVVRTELTAILPANAYKMCTGRLVISLTRWSDHKNVIVEEYDSNEDLIDAIMCSCFIPLYCGIYPPKYRGVQYIDGGVSDNQPKWGANTVTVSPFSGESDICPSDSDSASMMGIDFNGTSIRCTSRNMFRLMACLWPRSTEDLSKMCLQGFEDALRFLAKNGMAPCIRCLTITRLEGGTQTPEVFSDSDEKRGSVSSSSGNLAALLPPKPLRKRNSSSVLTRVRGDSECEACGEGDHKADVHVGHVFPSIMRKPFDEAVEAEKTMFDYVLSFRIVKFARTTLGVSKLPLDVFLVFAKKLSSSIYAYIEMISPTHWFMKKLQLLADFVLNEVNKQTSRYTNFQCHMSVTELDIDRSTTSNYYEEKEHEIELSVEAKQELDLLRARDKRRSRHRCKAAIPQRVSDPMAHGAYDDVDSFSHVVKQEAIYEFHYYDEDNKLRSFELFNMRPGQGARGTTPNTIDVVPEEDEDVEEDHSLVTFGPTRQESEEIDSGLSGVENQTPTTSFSKRDACCSPVREFSSNEGTSTTTPHTNLYNTIPPRGGAAAAKNRNAAAIRRNTMPNSSGMQRKQSKTHSLANAVSSDSDVDGTEKLFVPSRKAWRASHEMDGTPESEASATETP